MEMTEHQHKHQLSELLDSSEYKENLDFWSRAWGNVKTPYTQMPDYEYLDWIPARLEERGAKKLLDLGCGSGWLSIFLARRAYDVTGLDVANHAIELAHMWANQESLKIQFDLGDIADMHYEADSFDAVVANSIFEHFTFELADYTLEHLHKLLNKDGIFIGIFDNVGGGPGEYYELEDGSHIYTDKGRKGMLLRNFSDPELKQLFEDWKILEWKELSTGSRFVCATPRGK